MTLKESNYWLTTVNMPTGQPGPPPERVDVAVIGAGLTGLSTARGLARKGASVAVLDAHTIGWGASSRNGGMVLTGFKIGAEELLHRFGPERARQLYVASLAAIDCVEQIVREDGIDCDFARRGHLEVAYKPAHYRGFAAAAELLAREFNHPVRLVPRAELRAEIGSDLYHGGIVDDLSAGLNPARYVAGLARAAAGAGALIYEQAPVERLTRADGGFQLATPRGTLQAREVVVATSGYTSRITPAFQRRIVPIGSYIIATEVLPEALAQDVSPRNRMIFDSKNFLYYFRLTPDRRMLFGGRAGFFPETDSTIRESAAILRQGMIGVYPQLRDVAVEYAWGGTLDFAFDMLPHAGRMDGLWYALGFAGHGVALTTYLGTSLADQIAGKRADNPVANIDFPLAPLGLYNGRPWFLPVAQVYYRFLDWVS